MAQPKAETAGFSTVQKFPCNYNYTAGKYSRWKQFLQKLASAEVGNAARWFGRGGVSCVSLWGSGCTLLRRCPRRR